jgi:hypothetical protein
MNYRRYRLVLRNASGGELDTLYSNPVMEGVDSDEADSIELSVCLTVAASRWMLAPGDTITVEELLDSQPRSFLTNL